MPESLPATAPFIDQLSRVSQDGAKDRIESDPDALLALTRVGKGAEHLLRLLGEGGAVTRRALAGAAHEAAPALMQYRMDALGAERVTGSAITDLTGGVGGLLKVGPGALDVNTQAIGPYIALIESARREYEGLIHPTDAERTSLEGALPGSEFTRMIEGLKAGQARASDIERLMAPLALYAKRFAAFSSADLQVQLRLTTDALGEIVPNFEQLGRLILDRGGLSPSTRSQLRTILVQILTAVHELTMKVKHFHSPNSQTWTGHFNPHQLLTHYQRDLRLLEAARRNGQKPWPLGRLNGGVSLQSYTERVVPLRNRLAIATQYLGVTSTSGPAMNR